MAGLVEVVDDAGVFAGLALAGEVYSGAIGLYATEEWVWGSDVGQDWAGFICGPRVGADFGRVGDISANEDIRHASSSPTESSLGADGIPAGSFKASTLDTDLAFSTCNSRASIHTGVSTASLAHPTVFRGLALSWIGDTLASDAGST